MGNNGTGYRNTFMHSVHLILQASRLCLPAPGIILNRMTEAAIIQQAKHYFGKNRTYKRDLVLAYEFKGKNHRQWKKDIQQITSNVPVYDPCCEWRSACCKKHFLL